MGPRPPGLAPGVLGDGARLLGRALSTSTAAASTWSSRTTNEIAQAYGDAFARYWVHNAWVAVVSSEECKSLVAWVGEMVHAGGPHGVLRYYLGTPHYRSMIEYSEEALREAESAFARIEGFVQRVIASVVEPSAKSSPSPRPWTTRPRHAPGAGRGASGRATARWPPTTRTWPGSAEVGPNARRPQSTRSTPVGGEGDRRDLGRRGRHAGAHGPRPAPRPPGPEDGHRGRHPRPAGAVRPGSSRTPAGSALEPRPPLRQGPRLIDCAARPPDGTLQRRNRRTQACVKPHHGDG
ncbi:hypothetical protein SPURM210S_04879 [Streptomyces purpurascens]